MSSNNRNSKIKYLAKNTALFTIASFSSKILSFLFVPLYTSILSTDDYGTVDIVGTTASLICFVVALNIADSVLRFSIDRKCAQNEILGYGMALTIKGNIIFAILLTVFSVFNPIGWETYLYVFLFLQVLLTSLYNVVSNYLRAIDKVKTVAISGVIATFVVIICNILALIILKMGVIGYFIALLLGVLSSLVYCIHECDGFNDALNNATKDKKVQHAMLAYCIPLILNGIAWWISAGIDRYFIVGMINTSQNGIYSVSQKIPMILSTITTIFLQAWNLSAIKEFDKNDADGFFSNTYKMINTGVSILCSILILFNVFLASILFKNDFFIAWQCSSWLILSVLFSSMSSFEGSVFAAVKKSKIISISTVVSAFINIVFNFLLIPILGIQGAAISTVISFFSIWIIRYIYVIKYIRINISLIKDMLVYGLLVIQIILELQDNHCYLGQIFVLAMIICIYRNNIKSVVRFISSKVKRKLA